MSEMSSIHHRGVKEINSAARLPHVDPILQAS